MVFALQPRLGLSWRTAREKFLEDNPVSLWSGKRAKEVHHIIPVWLCHKIGRPDLITNPANFFGMASRKEHFILGHMGISWDTASLVIGKALPDRWEELAKALSDLDARQAELLFDSVYCLPGLN